MPRKLLYFSDFNFILGLIEEISLMYNTTYVIIINYDVHVTNLKNPTAYAIIISIHVDVV